MPLIPLDLLNAGEHARIVEVDGDQNQITRLREMGVREDVEVTMLQSGSPCIIAIDNHRISFRCSDQTTVLVDTD